MKVNSRIFFIPILYVVFLFVIALLPINGKQSAVNHTYILSIRLDYILHASLFFPWMSLLFITEKSLPQRATRVVLWFLFGLLLTLFTEGFQLFISYRTFNVFDLISNITGLLLGFVIFLFPYYFPQRLIKFKGK
jgi:VanZ family protein